MSNRNGRMETIEIALPLTFSLHPTGSWVDGAENAGRHGTDARIRHCPPSRTDERGCAPSKPGHDLSMPCAARAEAVDQDGVGRVRQQSQGQVLLHYQVGSKAARSGN